MLVNLSGKAGSFSAGDIIQEFFNRLLEAIIERKGAEFGDTYIREVVSRNLHHMGRIKKDLREGAGLAARAGRHSEPHTRPEVKTLLKQYQCHELHSRRPGRSIDEEDIDDFQQGWDRLAKGKLKRWVADTIDSRCQAKGQRTVAEADAMGSDSEDEDDRVEDGNVQPTFGSIHMVNGEMLIETSDFEETINTYISMLEAEYEEAPDSAEETDDEAGNSEEDS
jgi:hypothetical protein